MLGQNDISRKQALGVKLLMFVLFPFISFLYSLRRPNSKSSQIIFFLFGMLFAWTMDIHNSVYDFTRIVAEFYSKNLTTKELLNEISLFFVGESNFKEFYTAFLNWFVRLFSNNYHAVFLVASLPLLYFMLKSLRLITSDRDNYKPSLYSFVIIVLFILPFELFEVSNYRFATAAWIAIYSILRLFKEKKTRYYLLLLLVPFIHSGFWPLILFLVVYTVIPKREKIFKTLFYLSIPFAFIESNILSYIDFSFLPDTIAEWANAYLSDDMVSKFGMYRSGSGFYLVELFIRKSIVLSFIVGIMISIKKDNQNHIHDEQKHNFLYFLVLFFAFTDFIQIIPTLGERYFRLAEVLFIYHWFSCFSTKKYRKYVYLIIIPSLYIILYEKSQHYMNSLDFSFLVSNVFSIISENLGVTNYKSF